MPMEDILGGLLTDPWGRLIQPDYIGLVTGAEYKLGNDDGITSYALTMFFDGRSYLFEVSDGDLRALVGQIEGLIG